MIIETPIPPSLEPKPILKPLSWISSPFFDLFLPFSPFFFTQIKEISKIFNTHFPILSPNFVLSKDFCGRPHSTFWVALQWLPSRSHAPRLPRSPVSGPLRRRIGITATLSRRFRSIAVDLVDLLLWNRHSLGLRSVLRFCCNVLHG